MATNNKTINDTEIHDIFSKPIVASILTIYSLILLVGILGNVLTCAVVLAKLSMRRSIHFYTFNLAVTDIIILLIFVPTQMKQITDQLNWTMGRAMCSVAFSIIPLSLSASIATLVAISVDRFRGLRDPFTWRSESKRNAKIFIPLIWLASTAFTVPATYHVQLTVDHGFTFCRDKWPSQKWEISYWTFIMMIQYVVPLVFIACVHLYMAWKISNSNNSFNQFYKRMMIMVILLLITYSVCTGMQHINYFLGILHEVHNPYLFVLSNLVVSLQAAINPFIYGSTRQDYKEAFRDAIKYVMSRVQTKVLKQLVKMSSPNNTVSDELPSDEVTYNVTPIIYRRMEIKENERQSMERQSKVSKINNHVITKSSNVFLTVPSLYDYDDDNEAEEEIVEEESRRRRHKKRLETLEFLDVSELKQVQIKEKRNKWIFRTFFDRKLKSINNCHVIPRVDVTPPTIRISRVESIRKRASQFFSQSNNEKMYDTTNSTSLQPKEEDLTNFLNGNVVNLEMLQNLKESIL